MMHLQATESHAKDASKPPEASKNFPTGSKGAWLRPHRWQPTRLPVPGILQAQEHWKWVAISFSNESKYRYLFMI